MKRVIHRKEMHEGRCVGREGVEEGRKVCGIWADGKLVKERREGRKEGRKRPASP
jgi:hypothetical protein